MAIAFRLNGKKQSVDVPPMKRLIDTLREDLGQTGTKEGCGEGECGACTILVDGQAVNSCLIGTGQIEGAKLKTIEGVGKLAKLHRLQKAFIELGGAQCGICTPGMIMAALALPKRPTLQQIKEGLAGNLCRCTGYTKIYESVAVALDSPDKKKVAR